MANHNKNLVAAACLLTLSGCSHVVISDPKYIQEIKPVAYNAELKEFPLNIEAEMDCYSSPAGPNLVRVQCNNRRRVGIIAGGFADRGYSLKKATDASAPTVTLKVKELNRFLEGITGFFNVFTLGILPLYHHEYHIATYKSPVDNVEISKKVKIYSTSSWVSLFLPNSGGLREKEIEERAEANLVRAVLDEAKL